jgi:GDP-L-fucose synthase
MRNYSDEGHINIGLGEEVLIGDLTKPISRTVGFNGSLEFNTKFPDGTPRKLLDSKKVMKLGWQAEVGLEKGLARTYQSFTEGKQN